MPNSNLAARTSSPAIPRLIHQVCLSAELPSVVRESINALRDRNTGWLHQLYDDNAAEQFIADHYGAEMLRDYRSIDKSYGAARSDLFRYLVIYRLGGVYLDLKSTLLQPIDTVLGPHDRFIISQWRNGVGEQHQGNGLHRELADVQGGEFQQWHVIAAPEHPFLERVIEQVIGGIRNYRAGKYTVGWKGVLNLTGPIAYTRAIAPMLHHHPHRRIENEKIINLEFSVLPASDHQRLFKKHYSQNTSPIVRRQWPLRTLDQLSVLTDRVHHKLTVRPAR